MSTTTEKVLRALTTGSLTATFLGVKEKRGYEVGKTYSLYIQVGQSHIGVWKVTGTDACYHSYKTQEEFHENWRVELVDQHTLGLHWKPRRTLKAIEIFIEEVFKK